VDELIIASRLLQFAALTLLFGGSLFRLFIRPRISYQRKPWPRAIDIAVVVAALLSALGWFIGTAASMTGDWSEILEPDILAAVLVETRFGRLWTGRLAILMAMLGLTLVWRRQTRSREGFMLLLSGTLTASLAGVGHGSIGTGSLGLIHTAADMAHLLCAAAWLGGLVCLGLDLRDAAIGADVQSIDMVRTMLPRFARMGYVAVATLLMTGCINTLVLVPRPEALVETEYGGILLSKLGLVVVMIAIAMCNRLVFSPRILLGAQSPGSDAENTMTLYRSVAVEQVIGLLMLAAVAVLGTTHPIP
jgi:putative copper resistance protein D